MTIENEPSKEIRQVAKTLHIDLPAGNVPLLDGMIALLTSLGGLSIVANIFSDIVRPEPIDFGLHVLRLVIGIVMIAVGYGILKRKGWAVWLYATVCIVSVIVNPVLSVIPILITVYLYTQKSYFDPDLFNKPVRRRSNDVT